MIMIVPMTLIFIVKWENVLLIIAISVFIEVALRLQRVDSLVKMECSSF